VSALSGRRCWTRLSRHHEDVKDLQLRELFAADPGRGERFVAEGAGVYLWTNALIRRYRAMG